MFLTQRSCTSSPTGLIQRSCTSDPTGPWYKWPDRILIKIRILMQRSCKSGPTRSWYELSYTIWQRDLAQVVLQDQSSRSLSRILMQAVKQEPETEIWHRWSERILMQVVRKDLDLMQKISHKWSYTILDPDTSGPKDPDTETLHKWSYRMILALHKDPDTEISHKRSCTGS